MVLAVAQRSADSRRQCKQYIMGGSLGDIPHSEFIFVNSRGELRRMGESRSTKILQLPQKDSFME